MSYVREIPRDLFNEANLLKCYGQIYLNLEKLDAHHLLVHERDRLHFDVRQDASDGSLSVANIHLALGGERHYFYRPLNSREAWPLYMVHWEGDIDVFDDDGKFTAEMRAFITARR